MEIRNATPHAVDFIDENSNFIKTIEPCGKIARLGIDRHPIDTVEGIPVNQVRNVEDNSCFVPPPEDGVMWIVSKIFADEFPLRDDLFFPDDIVRDGKGRIIGCRALGTNCVK